jgi:hypothetical protein
VHAPHEPASFPSLTTASPLSASLLDAPLLDDAARIPSSGQVLKQVRAATRMGVCTDGWMYHHTAPMQPKALAAVASGWMPQGP